MIAHTYPPIDTEIRSLWIGGELSPLEQLTIRSFLNNGHRFVLFAYDEVINVPEGTEMRDANQIIPKEDIFLSHGSYAHFADWFRWRLLKLFGGYWVDMDVVCLKPFCLDREMIFGYEADRQPNVSVLKFPAGHPVCVEMDDRCANPNSFRHEDKLRDKWRKIKRRYLQNNARGSVKWGEAGGPRGFAVALERHCLLDQGLPFTYFYPVHSTNAASIFDSTLGKDVSMFNDSYGIHLWNEVLRKKKISKYAPFRDDSLIGALSRRYGP